MTGQTLELERPERVVEHPPGLTHSLDYSKEGLAMNATRTCSVDGCDGGPKLVRGYCNSHYLRFKRYGDATGHRPSRVMETLDQAHARFEGGYRISTAGCWEWMRSLNIDGYGQFHYNYKSIRAHRWSFERLYGPVPEGLVVGHKCDNKRCVNPEHLESITVKQNSQDAWDRGLSSNAGMKKTHCINGHLLPSPDANNRRVCNKCRVVRQRARRARQSPGTVVEGDDQ